MAIRRTKIVRRVPLVTKIRNYPYDLVLSWNETLQLIDWDEFAVDYSFYITFVFNLLLVLLEVYIDQSSARKFKALKVKPTKNAFVGVARTAYYVLVSASFLNFFLCVTAVKKYDLITRDIQSVPDTPSAVKVQLDTPVEEEEDSSSLVLRVLKYLAIRAYHRIFPKQRPTTTNQQKLSWRLFVWSPSAFQLHFLALFSPVNVLFVALISPIGLANLVFLAVLTAFQYFVIIFKYETKLKDEFILHQNFLQEYNTKFVNPRLNKPHIDKSVDGWNDGSVRAFYPDKRTKQFVTHSI